MLNNAAYHNFNISQKSNDRFHSLVYCNLSQKCHKTNNMKRKHWIRLGIGVVSTFLLLVVVLFIHIAMVTKADPIEDQRKRQLARIDFASDIDDKEASLIRKEMSDIKGMRTVKVNAEKDIVVYEIDPTLTSTSQVYTAVVENKGRNAKKFVIPASDRANGCPVIDRSSISYRLGKFFQDIL